MKRRQQNLKTRKQNKIGGTPFTHAVASRSSRSRSRSHSMKTSFKTPGKRVLAEQAKKRLEWENHEDILARQEVNRLSQILNKMNMKHFRQDFTFDNPDNDVYKTQVNRNNHNLLEFIRNRQGDPVQYTAAELHHMATTR